MLGFAAQMIVVSDPSAPDAFVPRGQYAAPSGLTPPTRNIRTRIFEHPTHNKVPCSTTYLFTYISSMYD